MFELGLTFGGEIVDGINKIWFLSTAHDQLLEWVAECPNGGRAGISLPPLQLGYQELRPFVVWRFEAIGLMRLRLPA